MVDGDLELPGPGLRQTSMRIDVRLGGKVGLLLGRSPDPSGDPLRCQSRLRGAKLPGAGQDEDE